MDDLAIWPKRAHAAQAQRRADWLPKAGWCRWIATLAVLLDLASTRALELSPADIPPEETAAELRHRLTAGLTAALTHGLTQRIEQHLHGKNGLQSQQDPSSTGTETSLLDFMEALLPHADAQPHMVVARADDDDPASVKFHQFEPLLATVLHAILPSLKRLAEQVQSEGKKGAGFVGLAAAVAEAVDGRLQAAVEA